MLKTDKCVHFNGISNKRCKAGIVYSDLAGPAPAWGRRLPCLDHGEPGQVHCESYREPTDEEIAKDREEWDNFMAKKRQEEELLKPLLLRIRKDHPNRSGSGMDNCPCCKDGKLSWSIAGYNGHIHMRCTTDGCVAFMQ
jgi:hypothetical protein